MVYAFVDSQNLNLSIKSSGWNLDFCKFRIYLRDKYKVEKAYLFIGYLQGNEKLYQSLQEYGYILIFKPTLTGKNAITKGNCDAELVLHCMIEIENFSKAVIVTGDGDFHCLVEYLEDKNKLKALGIPRKDKYSALLRKFSTHHFYINELKKKLEYEPKKKRVLVKGRNPRPNSPS